MILWLQENLSTIVVGLLLCGIVALIVRSIYKDRQRGISSCGSACGSCPMGKTCHKAKNQTFHFTR